MTVSSTTRRVDYVGNGAVDTYAYTFKVFANTHLVVTVQDPDSGDETTLTLTTDYTVTGVGSTSGGNVVLVDADQAWIDGDGDLKSDWALTIRRVLPLTQGTDIRNQTAFYASIHEDEFDKRVMVAQQQQDEIDRAIKFPTTDGDDLNATLPSASERASKFLAFDTDGSAIASSGGISDAIPVSAYMETLLDEVSAAAARATLGFSGTSGTVNYDNVSPTMITGQTADTSPDNNDVLLIFDNGGGALKKQTRGNLLKRVNATKTAAYTTTTADSLIYCNFASNDTITLHAAATCAGQVLEFINIHASTRATIDANSTETIGGALTRKIGIQYDCLRIISDGTNWQVLKSESIVAACKDTSTSIPGTGNLTSVEFTTEQYDTADAMTITTNSRFTAVVPGYYRVNALAQWANTVASGLSAMALIKDGSAYHEIDAINGAMGQYAMLQGSIDIYLAATNYINLAVKQSTGSPVALVGGYFTVAKIN